MSKYYCPCCGGFHEERFSDKGKIASDILAEKHTGMRISASGILGRIKTGWKVDRSLRFGCGEMLKHLEQMADRFYSGDIKVVDEFLQLYCLDNKRPKE